MVCVFGFDAWGLLGNTTTGHKLRGVCIPDTALIDNHALKAWYYTDKQTGVLHATPRSQLSTAALLHKLTAQHATYELSNPEGWVAVAYFANYVTRLVNKKELKELLSQVYVGAVPVDAAGEFAAAEQDDLQLLALQAFIIPKDDERYVTTLGGVEGAATLTQVRPYSSRFTAGASGAAAAEAAAGLIREAVAAGAVAAAGAIESQYGIQAATNVATANAARAALPTRGSCGSVISLCSHPPCCSESGVCLQHAASATAAAASCSCGGSNELATALSCQSQQQRQHSHAEGSTSTGSAELQLHAAMLEQQDGCVTPTKLAGTEGSLRKWQHDYADASGTEQTCCNTSKVGAGHSFTGAEDAAGDISAGYQTTDRDAPADGAVYTVAGNSGLPVLGTCTSNGRARDIVEHVNNPQANSSIQTAPGTVARAASAALRALISYLDKAHGFRVQGLAAEFIKDLSEQLWLIGLHNVTLDPQQSRGSGATFTERWGDFLAGAGPPPAPALPQHTTYGCSAATVCDAEACTGSCRLPGEPNAAMGPAVVAGVASPTQQLNKQFFPLLSVDLSEMPRCRPQSADPVISKGAARPMSARRCLRPGSPQPARPGTSPTRCRPSTTAFTQPASMDSSVGSGLLGSSKCRGSSGSSTIGSVRGMAGARYTSRNAASAARPGAGGNPTSRSSCCDSYALWMQQPVRPADSITAQLASQLEWAKEQVQQYADLAEAAQLQASSATEQAAQQVSSVHQELLQLRNDAAAASRERRHLQQQVTELDAQRSSSAAAVTAVQQQLGELQEQLAQDRQTMATMLRQHQQQKQQLEEEVSQLQQQNGELRFTAQQLASRLDEESEVVSALRAQLVDYKLQMEQIQMSAKKGRSLYTQGSTAGGTRRGDSSTPPAGQLLGGAGFGTTAAGGVSSSGLVLGSANGVTSLAGGNAATSDGAGGNWSLGSASGNQRRNPGLGTQMLQTALGMLNNALGASRAAVVDEAHMMQLPGAVLTGNSDSWSQSGSGQGGSNNSKPVDRMLSKAALAPTYSSTRATGSGRSTKQYYSGMLQPNVSGQTASGANTASSSSVTASSSNCGTVGPGSLLLQQLQQRPEEMLLQTPTQMDAKQHKCITDQPQQANSLIQAAGGACSSSGSGSFGSADPVSSQLSPQNGVQPPPTQQQQKGVPLDPDSAVAAIKAELVADMGEPLAAGRRMKPQLFIGDLLVTPYGALLPTAEQQLAVISGLFQEISGDLLEVWSYYALLGSQIQVVADTVTMDLKNLGKLAYDLHITQDSKSLSAVEDVFYLLSDRRPCLALKAKSRAPSTEPLPSRPGLQAANRHNTAATHAMFGAAAAAAAAAAGSAYLGPSVQHAVARAAASNHMGTDPHAKSTATAAAAAVMVSVLGPEVIVPEQFPEALTRLACVRYRWGVINSEYDWDDDDWSWEDQHIDEDQQEQEILGSPRMHRLQQQQKQEQAQSSKRGPKVLRPEGRDLYISNPPAVALRGKSSRPTSPGRAADYTVPTEADDLVTVVKTFLQHEVLKHARRNKLAGSILGHRRALRKPPNLVGWSQLPQGVIRG